MYMIKRLSVMNVLLKTVLYSLCLVLMSCATEPEEKQPLYTTTDAIKGVFSDALESNGTPASLPSDQEVQAALVPSINITLPGGSKVDSESRFDIKVNRANAKQFFMGLVDGTPYNMIVDPKVKGRITLDLKNVTMKDVMKTVRDVYGYDYELTGNRNFMVYPNEMGTRIYKLNYLDITRKGKSQVRVNSGQLTDIRSGNTLGGAGGIGSSGGAIPLSGNRPRGVQASSQIDTVTESEFWKDFELSIKTIVGNKEGRSVVISAQSGIVVVRAMPHELRTVERFIRETENIVQRQVVLEAKIIEVNLSDKFQAGINWSALAQSSSGTNSALFSHVGGGTVFDASENGLGTSGLQGNSGNLDPDNYSGVLGSATSAFGGVFTLALTLGTDFTTFIELLKGQGDVQVLSSPKISTLNNTKAVIKVGQEEFFVTNVNSNTAIATGTSNTSRSIELTPFFSGVVLDVVPQISESGSVTLFIHPSVSEVNEQNKQVVLSGSSESSDTLILPLAFSTVRESDTIINANSGQVVVIGGLMQDKKISFETSVPLLGDIPLIGALFRHTRDQTTKSELVILLKPIVVDADGKVWNDLIKQSRDRIESIHSVR